MLPFPYNGLLGVQGVWVQSLLKSSVGSLCITWRFVGTCKWSCKSPTLGQNYSYPTSISPLTIATHEPPSRGIVVSGDNYSEP